MQDQYRPNQTKTPPKKDDCVEPPQDEDCDCTEKDTATQKVINAERKIYCDAMDVAAGDVYQWEENYTGAASLADRKQCLFVWTEKNYRVIRNFEISTGTSLVQFNETIKDSTAGFLKANKALSDGLKDIVKKLKDARDKIYLLRTAANDLKNCTEGCNCNQWAVITDDYTNCKGETKKNDGNSTTKRPTECDGIKDKFEILFSSPKAIATEIDSIYKASADVVGIQVFSNIGTLDGIQKTLYDGAKALDKYLQDTMKKDQDDVKKSQDDFVKSVLDLAKSKGTLYGKRSDFVGSFETAATFCCPCCGCIEKKHCKEDICQICEDVQNTFCDCPPSGTATAS